MKTVFGVVSRSYVLGLLFLLLPVRGELGPALSSRESHRKLPEMVVFDRFACSSVHDGDHGNEAHATNAVR